MRRRRLLAGLVGLAVLAPAALRASEHGGGGGEDDKKKDEKKPEKKPNQLPIPAKGQRYVRLPTISLELWDKDGNFRMSTVDFLLLVTDDAKLSEKVLAEKMKRQLNSVPYEDYMAGNPAPMMKANMLDLARKEPGGDKILDILISKMLFR